MSEAVGRFAPSITGQPHHGTFLSALLAWLDVRSRGGRMLVRLEDLDRGRWREGLDRLMVESLDWLGIDWDALQYQSELYEGHERALETLAAAGRLYPCSCSRQDRKKGIVRDCRGRSLPQGGWRATDEPLRAHLPPLTSSIRDEGGELLWTNGAHQTTEHWDDPIVRRRDGLIAYQLAVVVDDAVFGVSRVVRGRDIAPSTPCQVGLQRLLNLATPTYRHHFLFLEERGGKLAKSHGSMGYDQLRDMYSGAAFCGVLAKLSGLRDGSEPCTPQELLRDFSWQRVRKEDLVLNSNCAALGALR